MPQESGKKDSGKSISDRLGINKKTDRTALNDLVNNDGNEDPGSELDTEFSNNPKSGTPPKGEELDAFTNNASKKQKLKKPHPKPQADEVMNPDLSSDNDI